MDININQLAISWLNSVKGVSNGNIVKILDYFGDPEELWYNFDDEKHNLYMLRPEIVHMLAETKDNFEYFLIKKLKEGNIKITTFYDEDYPKKLRNIEYAPCILYYKGHLNCTDLLSIAIVGSRKATGYGIWAAEKFSRELSELGLVIVSGLASGIDTAAHKAAIKAGGKTIGVIGCGIDIVYPKNNERLYEEIAEKGGCVLTEFTFGMAPMPPNFPIRNRIISGLSDGVLIAEAQEKSGTLITAGHAANQGKEIFSVPGNINSLYSRGTNALIRDGAKIVTSVEDIVEEIPELKAAYSNNRQKNSCSFNEKELKIMDCLKAGEKTISEISWETGLEAGELMGLLTILEMKKYIKQMPGQKFYKI